MTTITEFLLVRIAEDEAVALAAIEATGRRDRWWVDGPAEKSGKFWIYDTGEKFERQEVAKHIARHDPARVLAECKAKRAIVELHGDIDPCDAHDGSTMLSVPCDTLRALASVYADHEGFRAEWAL